MNNIRLDENNTSRSNFAMKYATNRSNIVRPNATTIRWWISILFIFVGLPALLFFLALGGIYALIGPCVILTGIQAVKRQQGWQVFGIITGGSFLFLGATTSFRPTNAGILGQIGGIGILLIGLGYISLTLLEMRQRKLP